MLVVDKPAFRITHSLAFFRKKKENSTPFQKMVSIGKDVCTYVSPKCRFYHLKEGGE